MSHLCDIIELFGGIKWCLIYVLTGLIVYQCVLKTWFYFSSRNVKFIRGVPFLGSAYQYILCLENASKSYERCYHEFPNERFVGIYDVLGKPSYLIRDPDLVKQILVTDFDHFVNHRLQVGEAEPLISRSLFGLKDERWRRMRATLSPAFTGKKMRLMHQLMVETTETFMEALRKLNKRSETIQSQEVFSRYGCDVIASCAFGLNVDSITYPDNPFYKAGVTMTRNDLSFTLKFLGYLCAPGLMEGLNIPIIDRETTNYFRDIVKGAIKKRVEDKEVRHDMIDLLIKARDGKLDDEVDKNDEGLITGSEPQSVDSAEKVTNWTDDDMVAQCLIFFNAGFQTVTNVFGFIIHELAINPDIQERAYQEVAEIKEQLNGQPLNYESLQKLKYLTMVINETLRKWAPANFIERLCNKAFTMENTDGTKVELQPGDPIWIPLSALQNDEKYFPNAENFDPERFNDNRKETIQFGTFMPFSIGPRNCIASRFALMEIKTLTYYLLCYYFIDKCERTQDPLQLKRGSFNTEPQNGFWVDLRRR